jgi:hypothetical protein
MFEHLAEGRNDAVREEHQSLIDEIAATGVAIESIREQEIARTGLDPSALSMLPALALYLQ